MRQINLLVIHCSATKENQTFTIQALETSHRKRGFNGIGYHVIGNTEGFSNGANTENDTPTTIMEI